MATTKENKGTRAFNETEPAADEIIKCCRFCFCDIKSKMGYKFHDYLILF